MTDEQIIIAVSKLDGWTECERKGYEGFWMPSDYVYDKSPYSKLKLLIELPPYLTSRDAIVPVIEKQITTEELMEKFGMCLISHNPKMTTVEFFKVVMFSTPRKLCVALLKAIGNFKE